MIEWLYRLRKGVVSLCVVTILFISVYGCDHSLLQPGEIKNLHECLDFLGKSFDIKSLSGMRDICDDLIEESENKLLKPFAGR